MAGSDEDRGRSRRLGAEGQGWSSRCRVFGGRTIERSGDTVCGLYRAQGDEIHEFLGLAPKPRSTVSPGLATKPVATVSLSLASKPVATIHVVWPQNHSLGFFGLSLKIGKCGLVIWPTKSPQQFLGLGLKTKWEEVCRFVPQNR
jgi:hypothetical protein